MQIAHVGVSSSISLRLFGRKIIFEFRSIPTYVIPVPKRYRQTNDIAYNLITALCVASRGKNIKTVLERLEKIHFRVLLKILN